MATINCTACKATIQADPLPAKCPACGAAIAESATNVSPNQSVAGDKRAAENPAPDAAQAPAPASSGPGRPETNVSTAAEVATAAVLPPAPAATGPAPPAESTTEKVLTGIDIGLSDVSAVSQLITKYFAGTPVEAIFKLLGPIAGIGAAVLAQHLAHRGFDLASLKDAEIL